MLHIDRAEAGQNQTHAACTWHSSRGAIHDGKQEGYLACCMACTCPAARGGAARAVSQSLVSGTRSPLSHARAELLHRDPTLPSCWQLNGLPRRRPHVAFDFCFSSHSLTSFSSYFSSTANMSKLMDKLSDKLANLGKGDKTDLGPVKANEHHGKMVDEPVATHTEQVPQTTTTEETATAKQPGTEEAAPKPVEPQAAPTEDVPKPVEPRAPETGTAEEAGKSAEPAAKPTERKEVFVGSIDQGTTSSRFLVFDTAGEPVAIHQEEFTQIYNQPG